MRKVYFDHAATTSLKPQVLEVMLPYLQDHYGNASSLYQLGQDSKRALERAREQLAILLGALPEEVYFTGSGTEANNWALKGLTYANQHKGKHIITSAIEHHAVLHPCQFLESQGFEVTYLPVDAAGLIDPQVVAAAIRPDTILLSVMWINNEIGTIQPIEQLAALAKERQIIFHTDAVQAVGKVAIDLSRLEIDALSLSAHKFHGPKGVGALYLRRGVAIEPLLHGGAQERDLRAGTENLAAIVGMAQALTLTLENLDSNQKYIGQLRDLCLERLRQAFPTVCLNGHPTKRSVANLNLSFPDLAGDELLLHLDMHGIAASSGSACSALSIEPSHVLLALGLEPSLAKNSLRLTFGEDNTLADIDYLLEVLTKFHKGQQ